MNSSSVFLEQLKSIYTSLIMNGFILQLNFYYSTTIFLFFYGMRNIVLKTDRSVPSPWDVAMAAEDLHYQR